MAKPSSLLWFAQHEARLTGRDLYAMLTAGHPTKKVVLALALFLCIFFLHFLAFGLVGPWASTHPEANIETLLMLSSSGLLYASVMTSQSLESVTRSYYGRADLELILSSPASSKKLFAVRAFGIALVSMVLSCVLASPIINLLILYDSYRWISAYVVLVCIGSTAASFAIFITLFLFRFIGPKRTRLVSQIVAAIVGAGFIIGLQLIGILYYNKYAGLNIFKEELFFNAAPSINSWLWIPAKAALGDISSLLILVSLSIFFLCFSIWVGAQSFARYAISTSSLSSASKRMKERQLFLKRRSQEQVLRSKEWLLLKRDPWLLSQILMQILYLLPPAVLLWINFGKDSSALIVIVPILVMASGQMAGGLAWLAISGEDCPDLIASAPVSPRMVLFAKIEAVTTIILYILIPLLLLLSFTSIEMVYVIACCASMAAASATTIQLWFRTISKRSVFRRRQTASRISTICEALISVLWAGAASVWIIHGSIIYATGPALVAFFILFIAWLLAPKQEVN